VRVIPSVSSCVLACALALAVAGCGGGEPASPTEVVLVTHESFVIPKQVKAAFERQSGLKLRILQGGDAGEAVNRALLTKGNPQGDVLFGIDNNLLSRALDEDLFEPYEAPGLDRVDNRYLLDLAHRVTPIDHGDVCLNVDKKWFGSRGIAPPRTLADLTEPRYRKLLVVENPATSTPGLAFLLATVARFGENGWQGYWRRLRANDVLVVDGWEEAYTARFSGAGGSKGTRPIVVSYATSPAAEVIFASKPPATAPTAVVVDSCFRQIELAGVLAGAKNVEGAHALIDFMLSERFQEAVPDSMFVLPVRNGTPLPDAFRRYAVSPPRPLELPAAAIGLNRDRWIEEWTQTVLR
jgi:thiamine transport system substrate-binding protein